LVKRFLLLFALLPLFSRALAAGREPIVLPLELRDKFPFLTVNVDGTEVKLKFDLGSGSALILQESTLDRIEAVPTGESESFQGLDGVFAAKKFKVARVVIGGATFTDVVTTMDAARKGYDPDPLSQGLLGTGLLKPYEVVIDYPQRTMQLVPRAKQGDPGSCKGTVVPLDRSSNKWRGEPVIKVRTEAVPMLLWLDTGSQLSAVRRSLTLELLQSTVDHVTLKRLRLGNTDFGPWEFQVWDMNLPGFDGFLGYDFFAKHVVCVDFPGKRIVIAS
jgi:aspartyl protease